MIVRMTTTQMLEGVLGYAYPVWVTIDEATELMPEYRSRQSAREHMNKLHSMGRVERRVRDTYHSPYEYRATEGDECQ